MNLFIYQLKQAYLSLKKKPGFVFSVVSTMGITLGALLCAITLSYLLLIEPLPYPEQERLFVAEHGFIDPKKNNDGYDFSYPGLVHLYQSKVAFEQAAMVLHGQDVMIFNNSTPLVNTAYVTPEFHQMLASPLVLGRLFEASEALDTNNPVAILSYNTWQQEFNGNTNILEQKIKLSGVSYRIIGVLSTKFFEPELAEIGRETQVWLPWDYNQTRERHRQGFGNTNRKLKFIGQLKERVNQSQAQQLLTPLVNDRWQEGIAEIKFFKDWSIEMRVRSVKEVILGQSELTAVILLAGVICLVLIACANISNLFMSRTAEKQRQIAIQSAFGATQKHLFKAMFAESSILMIMSIILALLVANIGFYTMQQYLAAVLPRANELSLNSATFGSAVLITLLSSLLFAKLSTRMLNYRTLNTKLQSSGKGSGLQVSKKARQVLITSQVTLATVLVFANLSLLKDAVKTINAPIGFATNNISTLVLNFSSTNFPSQQEAIPIIAEIVEKIETLPQVESISQSSTPLDGFGILTVTNLTTNEKYSPNSKWVDEKYFELIEHPILQGKNITVVDRRDRINVMVVNQTFAKQLNADGDVLGLQVSTGRPEPFKIIGIVKDITLPDDAAHDRESTGVPRVYRANSLTTETFMIKFKPDHLVDRQQLNKLIAEVDSRYSVFSLNSADDTLTKSLFAEITIAVSTAVLALITFFLAGIGLYGVLSYSIQMQRFEIGTRMAIGAKRYDLILMVIKDNMKPIIFGLLLSFVMLLMVYLSFNAELSSYFTMQLAPMFVTTFLLIFSLSLLACYLPLRQYIYKPASYSLRGTES